MVSHLDTAVPDKTSEDCLFLDVFTPANAVNSKKKLPVFFWIQGGGFATNSNPRYDGSGLVEASGQNIVVVLLNYRVGPHGFLAGKEIEQDASLNNGLKDQIKALKWVQKHIDKVNILLDDNKMPSLIVSSSAETLIMSLSVAIVPEEHLSPFCSLPMVAEMTDSLLAQPQSRRALEACSAYQEANLHTTNWSAGQAAARVKILWPVYGV